MGAVEDTQYGFKWHGLVEVRRAISGDIRKGRPFVVLDVLCANGERLQIDVTKRKVVVTRHKRVASKERA